MHAHFTEDNSKREDINFLIVEFPPQHLRSHPIWSAHHGHPRRVVTQWGAVTRGGGVGGGSDNTVGGSDTVGVSGTVTQQQPLFIPSLLIVVWRATAVNVVVISKHTCQSKISHHSRHVLQVIKDRSATV